jgi:hypothetical protein
MIEAGSTTVWESFADSNLSRPDYITRSHAHAWSSSPVYYLNKLVLGIRQTQAGGRRFEIGPWIEGLTWARGATAVPQGAVRVDWKIEGGRLSIRAEAPKGIQLEYRPNRTHAGLAVEFNGRSVA